MKMHQYNTWKQKVPYNCSCAPEDFERMGATVRGRLSSVHWHENMKGKVLVNAVPKDWWSLIGLTYHSRSHCQFSKENGQHRLLFEDTGLQQDFTLRKMLGAFHCIATLPLTCVKGTSRLSSRNIFAWISCHFHPCNLFPFFCRLICARNNQL